MNAAMVAVAVASTLDDAGIGALLSISIARTHAPDAISSTAPTLQIASPATSERAAYNLTIQSTS